MSSRKLPSLAYAPFRASLVVILTIAVFIGIFWGVNEYKRYRERIDNIKQNFNALYENRTRKDIDNIVDFIDHRRQRTNQRIENELREKVQSAYTITSHIFSMYGEEKSLHQLRSMVTEILRPIRWNNNRGYYFAGRLKENTIDLFADNPFLEGHPLERLKDQTGRAIAPALIRIISEKKAGVYRCLLKKENFTGKNVPSILFIKYFEPFDWYIGAAVSNEAMEKLLQEDILTTLQEMQFGEDGHFICFRFDGTIISHPEKKNIGRSVADLVGARGEPVGRIMLETGLEHATGADIYYTAAPTSLEQGGQRLSFVKAYPAWQWILAADISMWTMEKAIEEETQNYASISFKNYLLFIILFLSSILLLLSFAYYHSVKIKRGIVLFTDFFRKAADNQVKIKKTELAFSEFEDLAGFANAMVDDRIEKERTLRRNELRLDTLLKLGEMDPFSIKEKYDFVLHRIIRITGSRHGYIALVNQPMTHLALCSSISMETGRGEVDLDDTSSSMPLEESGLAGFCVLNKKMSIVNDNAADDSQTSFPYRHKVQRRIDVPLIYNSTVILAAGVCDGKGNYTAADMRQMIMLLEGMWLHIQKTCSEKEMAKLERQIIAISQEERSKIGRDLHDDLGSHLSGVELLSKVLQQQLEKKSLPLADQMATIRNLIRDAIEKTRRLSRGLYPVHVIEHGLEAALEELLTEIRQLYPVQCTLVFDSKVESLATDIAPHVYYIIREALFNAARHGQPDTLQVVIRRDINSLSVKIIDDGRGLMPRQNTRGLGLHTMQYRAKIIGGVLTIQPGKKTGTVVTLTGEVFS